MVSTYLSKAKRCLQSVRGKTISVEERRELSIELAANILREARRIQTTVERADLAKLSHMMEDPKGKVFSVQVSDQCFRTKDNLRVADQLVYLMKKWGIPHFFPYFQQIMMVGFKLVGKKFAKVLVPIFKKMVRRESRKVVLPGERTKLVVHMRERKKEKLRINLNHLGEAILGEEEALHRLGIYLRDLSRSDVEYISVKISTICSQINILGWKETLAILKPRFRQLLIKSKEHQFVQFNGKRKSKFVNLDMEEYHDLHLTFELFQSVLDEPEFYQHSAGIVLQSYLPDSHLVQQELTVWAMRRVANGGAPIKIRIVKGANLSMERVDASMHGWPQAPYMTKLDVDANFKRMLHYACIPGHARAVRVGVASHNLFDISYALLLVRELGVEKEVDFEMLEGMAEPVRRVVHQIFGNMLLYCPAATKKEFHNAIAYLVRRLDENTGPENFLRHLFSLIPGTKVWHTQANYFSLSCHNAASVSMSPRRVQNRFNEPLKPELDSEFLNECDTDFTLSQNRKWVESIVTQWKEEKIEPIPLVIGGKAKLTEERFVGVNPSKPGESLYEGSLATAEDVDEALQVSLKAKEGWAKTKADKRAQILSNVAQEFRKDRADLIGATMIDGGKLVSEIDVEISEAIDFIEYYIRSIQKFETCEDISFTSVGTVLVTPPWNFPCAIPTGGIAAALATGNSVIFKPAKETALIGYKLAELFWRGGISKEVLQFVLCEDDPVGSLLIKDERIDHVILTGATETAKKFRKMRPSLRLSAETGGKNAIIVTRLADRDLAIKNIIHSAFTNAGQKCSAASLLILEAEVYDDNHFIKSLQDAAKSLKVGSATDLSTKVNPLISKPSKKLMQGLTEIEPHEKWLLEPKQDVDNPNLWSPGIKMGVKRGDFSHQTEFFGPVLSVMRAKSLLEAIEIANSTEYGLTSGIQSLDEREHRIWIHRIEAGNLYINRPITGAIVQRQPFGGCKASSFGKGLKAGGPNYITEFVHKKQLKLPLDGEPLIGSLLSLGKKIKGMLNDDEWQLWNSSLENYHYWWKHYFSQKHDPSLIVGQDNILKFVSRKDIVYRILDEDFIDIMRVLGAAMICRVKLPISVDPKFVATMSEEKWSVISQLMVVIEESEKQFCERVEKGEIRRVRFLAKRGDALEKVLADNAVSLLDDPILANGRLELLNYVREVSISYDYHRYGHLGIREDEKRSTIL